MSGAITATAVAVGALSAAEVFTAVAVVGAAVGVIGTVTHVKELQYAGMALGAVGAVGGLAASAGLFAADAFGSMSGSALGEVAGGTTLAETASPFAQAAAPAAGSIDADIASWSTYGAQGAGSAAGMGGSDVISVASGMPANPSITSAPLSTAQVNAAPPSIPGATDAPIGGASAPNTMGEGGVDPPPGEPSPWTRAKDGMGDVPSGDPAGPAPPKFGTPTEPATAAPQPIINGAPNGPGSGQVADPSGGLMTLDKMRAGQNPADPTPDSVWSKIFDAIKTPGVGMLGFGAIQAMGSFVGGALSTKTPAEVKALEAQAGYNVAAANLANQQATLLQNQQANLAGGIPVARNPTPTGMINNAPPKLAPVTGTPA